MPSNLWKICNDILTDRFKSKSVKWNIKLARIAMLLDGAIWVCNGSCKPEKSCINCIAKNEVEAILNE